MTEATELVDRGDLVDRGERVASGVGDDDRAALMALSCVVEPGDSRIHPLLARFGPGEVWVMLRGGRVETPWTPRAATLSPGQVAAATDAAGLRFVVPGDDEWPEGVAALGDCEPVQRMGGPPLGLWVAGKRNLRQMLVSSIALVGSRASSAYGDRVAADWAAELASGGTTVVSGGAFGIDAAAHRGALAEGGPTVAILANGLDQLYPRAHESLLARVRSEGLLLSEYPPGEHPTRARFLARNRLIAACAQATVIVEGAFRSGARNTVTWANECGRPVGAVPGPVGSAQSFMPHRLVREGEAVLVASAAQVLELVNPLGGEAGARPPQERLFDSLSPAERAVYEALPARGLRGVGDLAVRSGLAVPVVLAALGGLAEAGMVRRGAEGLWKLGEVQNRPVASAKQDDQGGEC